MLPRPPSKPIVRCGAWLVALAGVGMAGLVSAQPSPPAQTVIMPPAETPPKISPSEAPPPDIVPTPAPLAVPPISAEDVKPAPPAEAKPVGPPVRRARYDVAIIEALDKVTAETLRFEAPVGRPIRYKNLVFTVKACERSAPDEPVEDSIAYLTIDSQPRPSPGRPALAPRQAFRGWMYASSPSLHALEHPVYAAWLITCRTAAPPVASPAR